MFKSLNFPNDSNVKTRLYSITETAEICGVSKDVVYRWVWSDGLPSILLPGSGRRKILKIDASDLNKWISEHRQNLSEQKAIESGRTLKLNGRKYLLEEENGLDNNLSRPSCVSYG